ncbi:MAG TPA: hypothetical protein EYG85_12210 [Crocinitomix sp.]|nr:hypothetical protein [Crocinitomix sp.]
MKKASVLFILTSVLLISFNSCKKGCTDPYATNYNAKKTKDNGKCEFYSRVILHSVDVLKIPEKNSNGNFWDAGTDGDLDNDNSFPDLYVSFKAEGGYSYEPSTYYPTIDPYNVDRNFDINPAIYTTEWRNNKGFYVYFYEVDLSGSVFDLIDSVQVIPFDINGSGDRFRDTLLITKGAIEFKANMSWE